MLDLSGHDRLADPGFLQYLDTLTEVAEGDPVEVGPGSAGRPFELGKRLLLHGDDGDVVTEAARALEREEGKPAVAGNQTDAGHWKSKSLSFGFRRGNASTDSLRNPAGATAALAGGLRRRRLRADDADADPDYRDVHRDVIPASGDHALVHDAHRRGRHGDADRGRPRRHQERRVQPGHVQRDR